jgi:quinol-cytochrome oxidoreductase complex cytochrome b subunit
MTSPEAWIIPLIVAAALGALLLLFLYLYLHRREYARPFLIKLGPWFALSMTVLGMSGTIVKNDRISIVVRFPFAMASLLLVLVTILVHLEWMRRHRRDL